MSKKTLRPKARRAKKTQHGKRKTQYGKDSQLFHAVGRIDDLDDPRLHARCLLIEAAGILRALGLRSVVAKLLDLDGEIVEVAS